MSAGSPRQPPYPALFYPAAWDLRSGGGGSGGGGGGVSSDSTAAAAAAAAAAALLDTRQAHQHRGHQQHPALHQQHLHHQQHRQQQQQRVAAAVSSRNPFDPQSRIPLPHPFGEFHFGCESSFIRRRNERERERVRFVNEGYERLKETLPFENKDKRISKVEILKTAIRYIQHMEGLLRAADQQQQQVDQRAATSGLKRRPLSHQPELQAESPGKRLRPT